MRLLQLGVGLLDGSAAGSGGHDVSGTSRRPPLSMSSSRVTGVIRGSGAQRHRGRGRSRRNCAARSIARRPRELARDRSGSSSFRPNASKLAELALENVWSQPWGKDGRGFGPSGIKLEVCDQGGGGNRRSVTRPDTVPPSAAIHRMMRARRPRSTGHSFAKQ
jgi:hypothetical protein